MGYNPTKGKKLRKEPLMDGYLFAANNMADYMANVRASLLTVGEAAKLLHVHKATVFKMIKIGKIPILKKVGNSYLIHRSQLFSSVRVGEKYMNIKDFALAHKLPVYIVKQACENGLFRFAVKTIATGEWRIAVSELRKYNTKRGRDWILENSLIKTTSPNQAILDAALSLK